MGQSRHQYDRRVFFVLGLLLIMLTGAYFRSSGLFRGLDKGVVFHPDAPKQVMALGNYLRGNYVQYFGSWFYDGYPYGLNRVDELVLRAISPFSNWVAGTLTPADGLFDPPTRSVLYYHVRVLRVLYGCLTILLIGLAARAGGLSRWFALLAAALYAIAPLGAVVTHSATGDVGVDLFIGFLLLAFALYMRTGRQGFCLIMGMSIGMAFACKYQGLLGGWVPAVFILAEYARRKFDWRNLVYRGVLGISGFLLGTVLLNPGLWIDFDRTWDDMRINFVNIKNYNIPDDFLSKSLLERIEYGLSHNFIETAGHLGGIASIMLVVMMLFSVLMLFGRIQFAGVRIFRKKHSQGACDQSQSLFWLAIGSFYCVSLFLATAMKPMVQPFHFSFLLPPLVLCCAYGLSLLYATKWIVIRMSSILVACVLVLAAFYGALQEDYFWSRSELSRYGRRYAADVIGDAGYGVDRFHGEDLVKRFFVEPSTKPVFRNRGSGLRTSHQWWDAHSALPVPSVMAGIQEDWVFMAGVQFPRDSRTVLLPAVGRGAVTRIDSENRVLVTGRFPWGHSGRIQKTLVFESVPENFYIGLRTGEQPSRYEFKVGGQRYEGFLLPNRERIIEVAQPKLDYHTLPYREVCGVGFKGKSEVGPLWVSMIPDEEHLAIYRSFGEHASSDGKAPLHHLQGQIREQAGHAISELPYLSSRSPLRVGRDWEALSPEKTMVLPGGGYQLELEVSAREQAVNLEFILRYFDKKPLGQAQSVHVEPDVSRVVLLFTKDFSPFEVMPHIRVDQGRDVVLESWTIRPSLDAIDRWEPDDRLVKEHQDGAFIFGNPKIGRVLAINIEPGRYGVDVILNPDIDHRDFYEAFLFIHLLDAQGKVAQALDIPLRLCSFDSRSLWWDLPAIADGEYRMVGGIFNSRTGKRFALRGGDDVRVNRDKRYAEVGTLAWPLP